MTLKTNFIYSSILTTSQYLFPLIIYPYISRTLGLSNIGIVNFVDNLINYFIIVSMMGIATVGVREIASARNEREKLSKTFSSLLSLTFITTLIAITVLWIAMYTVPMLIPYQDLLYVGIVKLVFNLFVMEWFLMGIEDFRFITIRSIIIKFIFLLCIFIYVRNALDYKIYYILSAATVIANAVVDIIYIRKFVHFSLPSIDIRPYYKAFFIMGAYVLLTNVYISLNPVWLGFVTNTDEVGYYTTATKLYNFIMAFLLSFTNILYPRVSNLLADGKREEYWQKIKIAFEAIYLFAFPTIIFMMVAGPQLLHLIVGDGFEGAYLPFRIITPLILIVGIEQILVIHILMATHSDNIVLRNSLIGAITTMVFNILLTSHLGAVGSAFVWIIVETLIMILSFIAIRHQFKFLFDYKRFFFYCINYTPLFLLSVFLYRLLKNDYAIIVSTAVLTVIYAIINEIYFMKNQVALQLLQSLKHRM